MAFFQGSKPVAANKEEGIIVIDVDTDHDSDDDVVVISDESEDEDVDVLSNDTGLVIANVWSLVDSTSSKDSTTELIHTPENDDSETTSSTEYQVGGTSSGLPQLKLPISTPFRHSLDPIRLHGL